MVENNPKPMTMKERMAMFNAGANSEADTKPKPAVAPKKKIDTSWMNKQNDTSQSAIVTDNKPNMFKQQIQQQKAAPATAAPVKKAEPVKEEVKQPTPAPVAKPAPTKAVEEVKEDKPVVAQKKGKIDTSWLNKGNSQTEVVIPEKPKVTAPAKTANNSAASWIKKQEVPQVEETKKAEPAPVAKPAAKKIDTSWMQNQQASQSEALPQAKKSVGGLAARFAAQQAAAEEERKKQDEEKAAQRKKTMAAKKAEREGEGDKAAFKNSLEAMLARGPGARKATVQQKSTSNIEEVKEKIKPDIFVDGDDSGSDEDDPFKAAEKRGKRERQNAQLVTQQALLDKPVIAKKRGNTTRYDADNFDF